MGGRRSGGDLWYSARGWRGLASPNRQRTSVMRRQWEPGTAGNCWHSTRRT